jgi:hypothetical protein
MSQKSSLPQTASSVSQVLKRDIPFAFRPAAGDIARRADYLVMQLLAIHRVAQVLRSPLLSFRPNVVGFGNDNVAFFPSPTSPLRHPGQPHTVIKALACGTVDRVIALGIVTKAADCKAGTDGKSCPCSRARLI